MQRNKQTDGAGVAAAEGRGGISTVYEARVGRMIWALFSVSLSGRAEEDLRLRQRVHSQGFWCVGRLFGTP